MKKGSLVAFHFHIVGEHLLYYRVVYINSIMLVVRKADDLNSKTSVALFKIKGPACVYSINMILGKI